MKPRANVAKTIERMLKKLTRQWNQIHMVDGDKAVILSPHYVYIIDPEKTRDVNDAWIATPKEDAHNAYIKERRWEKIMPDESLKLTNIVVEYSELRKMPTIETKYNSKLVKLAADGNVIYILLENLINAFQILQESELTINLYKSKYSFARPRIDPATGMEMNLNPFTIQANNNTFLCAPCIGANL